MQGGSVQKGYLFQASDIRKVGFHYLKYRKGLGSLCFHQSAKKNLKRLKEEFMVVKKSRKFLGFVMECSKLGVPLLNGWYMKGVQVPLLSKIVYKRVAPD